MVEIPSRPDSGDSPQGFPAYEAPGHTHTNSIKIAEEFFGEPLSDGTIQTAAQLTYNQQEELRQRLNNHLSTLHGHLPAEGYPNVRGPEVHYYDEAIVGVQKSLTAIPGLKHAALYFEKTLVADPLIRWSRQSHISERSGAAATELARSLREVLPVADLVRDGHFILYPEWNKGNPAEPALVITALFTDPMLRTPLSNSPIPKESNIFEEMAKGYPQVRGRAITGQELFVGMSMVQAMRNNKVTPATSNRSVAQYLHEFAHAYVDDETGGPTDFAQQLHGVQSASIDHAVQYSLPNLQGVSLEEVAHLRRHEEVFALVRNALRDLQTAAAREQDYPSYAAAVHEASADIIGPAQAQLDAWRRQRAIQKIAGFVAGRTITLTMSALAISTSNPPLRSIGRPLGTGTEKIIRHPGADTERAVTTANTILKSLF